MAQKTILEVVLLLALHSFFKPIMIKRCPLINKAKSGVKATNKLDFIG